MEIMKELTTLGQVTNGQQSFPFSFTIPQQIPPSFEWMESASLSAKTEYFLRAEGPNGVEKIQKIYIANKIDQKQALSTGQSLQTKMNVICYCCYKKGLVELNGQFEKSMYVSGDTINMIADINNESTSKLKISGECNLYVDLNDGIRSSKTKLTCGRIQLQQDILPKTKLSQQPLSFEFLGNDAMPSCKIGVGNYLINAEYCVGITVKPDVCQCGNETNPNASIEIQVGAKLPTYQAQGQPDNKWAPKVFKPVSFNVNPIPFRPNIPQNGAMTQPMQPMSYGTPKF